MSSNLTENPPINVLPEPNDPADSDVVIYDGHCRFCTAQAKRLARLDAAGRLAFLSLHDERVARDYPDLTHQQLMDQMYLVDQQGRRHGGAVAFRYLSRRLPWLWPLAPLMHIPFSLPLWQWVYGQVAQRRYRLGKTESCDEGTCHIHFK